MINSRKIEDLHPKVQLLCLDFISACKTQGIEVLITSTFRDFASQRALYAQGRTVAGKVVTNANAGQSFHNFRVAFDFVPLIAGKPVWNDKYLFARCGKIAENLGLEWGGSWKRFKDLPHCQYTGGLTIEDFNKGLTLKD